MENNEESSPTGNQIAIIFSLLCVLLCIWLVVTDRQEEAALLNGSQSTCGRVYDYVGKDADGNTLVLYEYQVQGHTYKGYTSDYEFDGCEETRACIGKHFLVRFATENPEVNRHYFDQECP